MVKNVCVPLKVKHGYAKGGPYIAVHLRRRDFLYGHAEDVPSINRTAEQLLPLIEKYKVNKVFVATDAPEEGKMTFIINTTNI